MPMLDSAVDIGGTGVGFLVPLFSDHPNPNHYKIQILDADDTVAGFADIVLDNEVRMPVSDKHEAVAGHPALWAFRLPSGRLYTGDTRRLASFSKHILASDALADHPMACAELIRFAELEEHFPDQTKAALDRLKEMSTIGAAIWCETAILLPMIRRAFGKHKLKNLAVLLEQIVVEVADHAAHVWAPPALLSAGRPDLTQAERIAGFYGIRTVELAVRPNAADVGGRGVAPVDPMFRSDVTRGLQSQPKAIPARWFYDERGSELFGAIRELPEYYPYRAEISILQEGGSSIAERAGSRSALIEFGAGSMEKTAVMLKAVAADYYVPIDISGEFLRKQAAQIARDFPALVVLPVEADFSKPVPLPRDVASLPKLGFLPGGIIGNVDPVSAIDLLRTIRATLGEQSQLLIGMDLIKNVDTLLAAYDDAAGTTAAFNLNLLARMNRELGLGLPMNAFRHRVIWNEQLARIEMHLEATRDVTFDLDGQTIVIVAGETVHTENSHKFDARSARLLLMAGGWAPAGEWSDVDQQFLVMLGNVRQDTFGP